MSGVFCCSRYLFDGNLSLGRGLAAKTALLDFAKTDDTVNGSVNRKVTTYERARSGNLGRTGLTNQYFASADFLTAKALNAKSLTGIIMNILGRTASFDV